MFGRESGHTKSGGWVDGRIVPLPQGRSIFPKAQRKRDKVLSCGRMCEIDQADIDFAFDSTGIIGQVEWRSVAVVVGVRMMMRVTTVFVSVRRVMTVRRLMSIGLARLAPASTDTVAPLFSRGSVPIRLGQPSGSVPMFSILVIFIKLDRGRRRRTT